MAKNFSLKKQFNKFLFSSPTRVSPSIGRPMSPIGRNPVTKVLWEGVQAFFSAGSLRTFHWSSCSVRNLRFEDLEIAFAFSLVSFSCFAPSEGPAGFALAGPVDWIAKIPPFEFRFWFSLFWSSSAVRRRDGNQEGGENESLKMSFKRLKIFVISFLLSGQLQAVVSVGVNSQSLNPTVRSGRVEKVLNFVPVRNNELNFSLLPAVKVVLLRRRIISLRKCYKVFCLEGG
jgi:hypothetical protein